jgi:L-ascorbate metabolism protein UlaG (beta-lactamase superfamily)
MPSIIDSVSATLGLTAAKRGRELSSTSPQHDGKRFNNVKPRPVERFGKTLRIAWNLLFNKPCGTVPAGALPVDSLTREALDAAPDRSLYRLGHSTMLLKLRGQFWLTDPVFAERASPFRRFGPKRFHAPPIALADLPPLRGVILSHDHYDHLDKETVLALAEVTNVFLTPLGVGDRLIEWGIDAAKVRQFDWWQGTVVDGLEFTAAPAQHFSGRSLFDGNSTLWASWVIVDADLRVFFSGDTGYFDGFKTIGERLGPFDVTLLETGAYDAQWPYVHMQPEHTVQAHIDLRGRWLMPIHNGTFDLAMHRWQDPFERVASLCAAHNVAISTPRMGERLNLAAPHRGERWWRNVVETASHALPLDPNVA